MRPRDGRSAVLVAMSIAGLATGKAKGKTGTGKKQVKSDGEDESTHMFGISHGEGRLRQWGRTQRFVWGQRLGTDVPKRIGLQLRSA